MMCFDPISYDKAEKAMKHSKNVQEQLNQAIAAGDQLAETQQARVDDTGVAHPTLNDRITSDVIKLKNKDDEIVSWLAESTQRLLNNFDSILKTTPADKNKYDELNETLIVADDHTKFRRTVELSTDTTRLFEGRNTVLFSGDGVSPYTFYDFPTPIDLTKYDYLEMWIYLNDFDAAIPTSSQSIVIYDVESPSGSSPDYYYLHIQPNMWQIGRGELGSGWRRFRASLADIVKVGENPVDLTSVTCFRFYFGGTSSSQIRYNLAQVNGVKVKKGIICIDFDDGYETDYTIAYPIMKELDLRGTCYVITSRIGESGRMTVAQLTELKKAGWTIASHLHEHLNVTTLTEQEITYQMQKSQDLLKSWGFISGSYFCATPGGSWNQTARTVAKKIYLATRIGREFPKYDPIPPDDNYTIKYRGVDATDSIEELKAIVDEIAQTKRCHRFTFHRLADPASGVIVSPSIFQELMEYIALNRDNGLIDVLTAEEQFLQFKI